ncbi:MAG: sigma-54-dependent Fis family transcriptional regulator [Candidatus Wallbacteria bacterium]|nr:sigma-54-dependent Fis family transcriptional regulator [Candidatus Wallbacteria bacterium]
MEKTSRRRVLVLDDDRAIVESVRDFLCLEGYDVLAETSPDAALARLDRGDIPDIAIIDLLLNQADGIELIAEVRKRAVLPVVIMTGHGTIESAVRAMKNGAADFLLKPFEPDILPMLIEKTLRSDDLERENARLRAEIDDRFQTGQLLGQDPKIVRLRQMIGEVGPSMAPVLLTGETGTGKEVVARAIHGASPRAEMPFVAVNCGAIPEELFETEFFGHEKGAFTGAAQARQGKVEAAARGTLFLDEVGTMPMRLQAKLLRLLQEHEYERVGSQVSRRADFRLISATNVDLDEGIRTKQFRQDLFFRLNVVPISLPPLRERPGDIPLLADHFLRKYASETGRPVRAFGPQALREMATYSWPGNVRELASVVERAVLLSRGELLSAVPISPQAPDVTVPFVTALREFRATFERAYLEGLFSSTQGNVSRAATISGLSRRHLQRMKIKLGLEIQTFARPPSEPA